MTSAPPPGYIKLVLEDFPSAESGRALLVYPAGNNARWLLRELRKRGAQRPARRWPDGVWFPYSADTLRLVEETALRIMRVQIRLPSAVTSAEHFSDDRVADLEDLMDWSDDGDESLDALVDAAAAAE